MIYKITHSTTYIYETPVAVCHNLVMLTPRDDGNVRSLSHRLTIRPTPPISARRKDFFGNSVHSFSTEENHKQLTVTATSRVQVSPPNLPADETTVSWERVVHALKEQQDPNWLSVCPFQYDSPRVRRNTDFESFSKESFSPERPVLAAVRDLTTRIYGHFKYDSKATHVGTPTEDAFKLARGVCQDFAHVQLACLRSIGIPARYVSGYLRTNPPPGKPRLIGADQSHAWVAAYCGPDLGWVDVDPTNNCLCSTDHITIAWGRDYGDVAPIRGVFLGGGHHQLLVSVDVHPETEQPPS
ncbi:MAG: transglutaminase family protein [Planctomycetaceae bacterium]|nr:transglutaminase family protein [Planctomycetaceae bacterium]